MDQLVGESGETLNWRTSIVDTMKALGVDSSLERRKQLAEELKYDGDVNDSASMNVWLHKQVMLALAANGGSCRPIWRAEFAMGLRAMGIANEIVQLAFALVLGGIAVAVALSFGIGGLKRPASCSNAGSLPGRNELR
ncbi:hypothetical protein P3T25_007251 [Paraburkholderia sp. GAS32]